MHGSDWYLESAQTDLDWYLELTVNFLQGMIWYLKAAYAA